MNAEIKGTMGCKSAADTAQLAKRIRIHVLRMTNRGGSSHIGASYSVADLLAVLYGRILRVDPESPRREDRDRFILSKGHAGAAVYACLAECGFFPTDQLLGHYQDGSYLSGHVSHVGVPGVDFSTGSLGHGLSVGVGLAYGAKLDRASWRVFVVLSDGECDEGSTWEAVLFAGHHRLDNLIAIVDYNKIQSLASVEETLSLEPFKAKWDAFGWEVIEVDGHDHGAIFSSIAGLPRASDRPLVVLAHTTKGKGVSFMENTVLWHYRVPQGEEFDQALAELEAS